MPGPLDRVQPSVGPKPGLLLEYLVRRGGLEPPRCYPLAPQANHRTRCHTIVSIYEHVSGVIERGWCRQLAQERHNYCARPAEPAQRPLG